MKKFNAWFRQHKFFWYYMLETHIYLTTNGRFVTIYLKRFQKIKYEWCTTQRCCSNARQRHGRYSTTPVQQKLRYTNSIILYFSLIFNVNICVYCQFLIFFDINFNFRRAVSVDAYWRLFYLSGFSHKIPL